MRSTLFRFSILALPLALLSAAMGVACDDSASLASFRSAEAADAPASGAPGGSTSFNNSSDAGTSHNAPSNGSPLCRITAGECLPDDDGQRPLSYEAAACADPPDSGAADMDEPARACRIAEASAGTFAPKCQGDADRRGVDGVSCSTGSDCAPGFDCVDGEKGPVCRRYCCAGSCADQASQSGGPTFCDVQPLVDYRRDDVKAPVCMPVKACKLLRVGECSANETCAVINEKGATGCVELGPAKAGASCDTDHCAAGLTCLGSPGDRRCYKLCRVDGADCAPTQACTTGSVFQDTTYGVCKDN